MSVTVTATATATRPAATNGDDVRSVPARARGDRGPSHGRRARRSLPALLVIAALAPLGLSAPAAARPPLTAKCNSVWMSEAGTAGAGRGFEVSMRPRNAARVVPAHGGTDRIWGALWRCVPGGYPAARLTPQQGESVYQQLYCHIKYGYHPALGGDTWDLEARRPPISWDRIVDPFKAVRHKCNW